jgi:hypothetical protein
VLLVKIWWQNVCYLLRNCLCLNIVLYLLFKGQTPLHLVAWKGKTEVVDLLLMSGASLSVMNNEVIKSSVKLRHSNIKLFKYRIILLLKQKMFRVLWRYKKNMIWWQLLSAWTDWFVTSNGESIKRVVWHLVLILWSNRIRNC